MYMKGWEEREREREREGGRERRRRRRRGLQTECTLRNLYMVMHYIVLLRLHTTVIL